MRMSSNKNLNDLFHAARNEAGSQPDLLSGGEAEQLLRTTVMQSVPVTHTIGQQLYQRLLSTPLRLGTTVMTTASLVTIGALALGTLASSSPTVTHSPRANASPVFSNNVAAPSTAVADRVAVHPSHRGPSPQLPPDPPPLMVKVEPTLPEQIGTTPFSAVDSLKPIEMSPDQLARLGVALDPDGTITCYDKSSTTGKVNKFYFDSKGLFGGAFLTPEEERTVTASTVVPRIVTTTSGAQKLYSFGTDKSGHPNLFINFERGDSLNHESVSMSVSRSDSGDARRIEKKSIRITRNGSTNRSNIFSNSSTNLFSNSNGGIALTPNSTPSNVKVYTLNDLDKTPSTTDGSRILSEETQVEIGDSLPQNSVKVFGNFSAHFSDSVRGNRPGVRMQFIQVDSDQAIVGKGDLTAIADVNSSSMDMAEHFKRRLDSIEKYPVMKSQRVFGRFSSHYVDSVKALHPNERIEFFPVDSGQRVVVKNRVMVIRDGALDAEDSDVSTFGLNEKIQQAFKLGHDSIAHVLMLKVSNILQSIPNSSSPSQNQNFEQGYRLLTHDTVQWNQLIPILVRNTNIPGQPHELIFWYDAVPEVTNLLPHLSAPYTMPKADHIALSVYPNPTPGATTIHYDMKGAKSAEFSIHNLLGAKMMDGGTTSGLSGDVKLDLSSLDAGVYLLITVTDDGQRDVERIIVTK